MIIIWQYHITISIILANYELIFNAFMLIDLVEMELSLFMDFAISLANIKCPD